MRVFRWGIGELRSLRSHDLMSGEGVPAARQFLQHVATVRNAALKPHFRTMCAVHTRKAPRAI